MPTAATKKSRLSLPTPQEIGQVLFLRSRGLTHNEIAKHFGKRAATVTMQRALTMDELWNQPGVQEAIDSMYEQELLGIDWYTKYAVNPYGKRKVAKKGTKD